MSSRRVRLITTLVLVFSTVPFVAGAGNGNGNGDEARAEHQRIVDFWTPERVAQTVPRHFVFDPDNGRFSPSKGKPAGTPGGGGGGGNGDEPTVVTGSSWKKGGEIDGAVGKVLFALGTSYYVCSATVIDDGSILPDGSAMILTAAHCVYDESPGGGFADNWMFIPDYDDKPASLTTSGSFCSSTAYGCWTPEAMAVHNGYATAGGFNYQAVEHDFAVVRVGPGGLSGSAELDHVVTEQGYSFSSVAIDGSVGGYAFGYPAQKKWKGNDLIYCRGPIDTDPINNGDTYRLNGCKLNGGSSGGAWLTPFDLDGFGAGTVVSVNSYGYRGIDAMHGPKLNSDTQAVYTAVLGVLIEGTNAIAR